MRALAPLDRGLALLLAGLAGYVDSLGFLQLGGVFVSFMSGNSTRLAASLASGHWLAVGHLAAILAVFVLGSFLGALIAGVRARGHAAAFYCSKGCCWPVRPWRRRSV